jgi:transketolase
MKIEDFLKNYSTITMQSNILTNKKRCNSFRKKILELSQKVSALHIGGSFSSVEIIDCIFNLVKKKNDKFILSKGHAGILLYVILNYLNRAFIDFQI